MTQLGLVRPVDRRPALIRSYSLEVLDQFSRRAKVRKEGLPLFKCEKMRTDCVSQIVRSSNFL